MRTHAGFTLVELMIVVAIIGVLAALAIPSFRSMQYRAKRAEIPTLVDGIRTAQLSYYTANDSALDCDAAPRSRAEMDGNALEWSTVADSNWNDLSWRPDGAVRGSYTTNSDDTRIFTVLGATDVDDDDNEAQYEASQSETTVMISNPANY